MPGSKALSMPVAAAGTSLLPPDQAPGLTSTGPVGLLAQRAPRSVRHRIERDHAPADRQL
jgi:hypothetical protein